MERKILQKESYQPIWFNLQNIFQALQKPKNHQVGPKKSQEKSQIDLLMT